jgi:hypothetical protein
VCVCVCVITSGWTRLVSVALIKVRSDVTLTGSYFGLVNLVRITYSISEVSFD